jgi:hypothetical protein
MFPQGPNVTVEENSALRGKFKRNSAAFAVALLKLSRAIR